VKTGYKINTRYLITVFVQHAIKKVKSTAAFCVITSTVYKRFVLLTYLLIYSLTLLFTVGLFAGLKKLVRRNL